MNVKTLGAHWTDEQLIARLYGVGPHEGHLDECRECQRRLASLQACRRALESDAGETDVSFEFLALQRRAIYRRLGNPSRWWLNPQWRRWASVAAAVIIMTGGIAFYSEQHVRKTPGSELSDAQLAQEVSRISQEYEAPPTAPLRGLFE